MRNQQFIVAKKLNNFRSTSVNNELKGVNSF